MLYLGENLIIPLIVDHHNSFQISYLNMFFTGIKTMSNVRKLASLVLSWEGSREKELADQASSHMLTFSRGSMKNTCRSLLAVTLAVTWEIKWCGDLPSPCQTFPLLLLVMCGSVTWACFPFQLSAVALGMHEGLPCAHLLSVLALL